jgi:hypothetical protein
MLKNSLANSLLPSSWAPILEGPITEYDSLFHRLKKKS